MLTTWSPQTTKVANYGEFHIGTQSEGYALQVDDYSGTGGLVDDLSDSNGRVFFASDHPDPNQCAVHQRGGWWFNKCAKAFLNGFHYPQGKYTPPGGFYDGIYWKDWLDYDYSLQFVTMAVTHPWSVSFHYFAWTVIKFFVVQMVRKGPFFCPYYILFVII